MKNKQLYNKISKEIIFLKDCLIDMSTNLIELNKLKMFDTTENGYLVLFDEINLIKDKIKNIPDYISFKYLNKINNEINMIKLMIIQYINHIAPNNMKTIYQLLFGADYQIIFKSIFNREEVEYLELLSRLFTPISVWDSSLHSKSIDYINKKETNIKMNKEFIDSIIESKNDRVQSIVIGDVTSFPNFLKNITEIITKDKRILKQDRKITFNSIELLKLFDNTNNNIIFSKNQSTLSLVEDKQGFMVIIKIKNNHTINDTISTEFTEKDNISHNNDVDPSNPIIKDFHRIIVIQGIVKDDILELYKTNPRINQKIQDIKKYILLDENYIPLYFKTNLIDILNIRDILVFSKEEIGSIIKKRYNDYKILQTKTLGNLINEFLLASKFRKIEILVLFLAGSVQDNKLGFILYDILRIKDKSDITQDIYNSLHTILKLKFETTNNILKDEEETILKASLDDLSYERRINIMNIDISIKNKAIEKLKSLNNNLQGDNKAQSWLDGFLKIPFGVYCENQIISFKKNLLDSINKKYPNKLLYSNQDITKLLNEEKLEKENLDKWNKYNIDRSLYLKEIRLKLDKSVYGHKEAKLQLERLFAQWINGMTKGAVIGLMGPPGTGKTSLIKNGLSQCLTDSDGISRPFGFLPIGGSVNGSTLVGHNYTYVGSTWGRIVDILMVSGCMNPIIFIDEVDKISSTEYGKEIVSILTHLTDATQNDSFEDKYFSGIPLDLSKALIVLSFNDISIIDPILKDRITIIETKSYNINEKIHIIQDYMLPEILKDIGFNKDEIIFSDDILKYIINTFTNEAGVRKVKEKIVEIIRDINLNLIHCINQPTIITQDYIDSLFKNKPKIKQNKIHSIPEIGLVNGLYATNTGIGGLTVIQVIKYPSDKMLELKMTGQQGEVMKESVEYAMKIAFNLLTPEEQNKILEDSKNKNNFGLLIHTPDAGTKKEGPSAGAAMTLAIYSVLTNRKVDNTIALTGEIDLWKNIKEIGGLYAKLNGAKNAGIRLALIPRDNMEDLEILRNEMISPEDEIFKVEIVDTIEDIIQLALV